MTNAKAAHPNMTITILYTKLNREFSMALVLYDLVRNKIYIYNRMNKCYNKFVTAPILVTGRGEHNGYTIFSLPLCCG